MLGRFLEFSIATADIGASLEFYTRLGFSAAEVGEAWPHPYAVLTDGRVCLGLHQHPDFLPSLTFVRPELLKHLARLEGMGLTFEFRHLANDMFNEIGWLDPSGHLIRLVEARTFSPSRRPRSALSLCGRFLEIALPATDTEVSKAHWEQCGFVGVQDPGPALPHVSCSGDGVNIGLYQAAHLAEPALRFAAVGLEATLASLESLGIWPNGRAPVLRHDSPVLLRAPEGTAILLTAAPAA